MEYKWKMFVRSKEKMAVTAHSQMTSKPWLLSNVTGIRGGNPEKRTVCRKSKTPERAVFSLTEVETSAVEEQEILASVMGKKSPVMEENLEDDLDLPKRELNTTEVKRALYRRECQKVGVTPIGSYLRSPDTKELVLKHYSIGPKGARALAVPLMLDPTLTRVDLEGNDLGAAGMRNLVEVLVENSSITHLNLSNNYIGLKGKGGALSVCSLIKHHKSLQSINLSDNHFADSEGAVFAEILKWSKTLKELILANNKLGDESGPKIGDGLANNDSLEFLDLSWNQFRGKSAVCLCNGVKENVGLKRLNLSNNGFGAEGLHAMGEALAVNRSLLELDLSSNRIVGVFQTMDEKAKNLTAKLSANDTLEKLWLGDNPLTPVACLALLMTLQKAESSAIHLLDLSGVVVTPDFVDVLAEIQQQRKLAVMTGGVLKNRIIRENKPPLTSGEGDNSAKPVPANASAAAVNGTASLADVVERVQSASTDTSAETDGNGDNNVLVTKDEPVDTVQSEVQQDNENDDNDDKEEQDHEETDGTGDRGEVTVAENGVATPESDSAANPL